MGSSTSSNASAPPGLSSAVCSATITWKSGVRLESRSGCTASTTRSNGTSWWANASSTVSLTSARNSRNGRAESTVDRRTSVLTKNPISRCSSARSRPAVTVPTATSSCPAQRARRSWQAATRVMNSVPPWALASSRRPAVTSAGISKSTQPPSVVRTGGRGRSVGSSSGWAPASRSRQCSSCPASRGPSRDFRCQTAKSAYWTGSSGSCGSSPRTNAV